MTKGGMKTPCPNSHRHLGLFSFGKWEPCWGRAGKPAIHPPAPGRPSLHVTYCYFPQSTVFLWLGWGHGVLVELALDLDLHSPSPPKGGSAEISLCFSWGGMWWNQSRVRAESFLFPAVFPSKEVFFFFFGCCWFFSPTSKDDAPFQRVLICKLVSSVYSSAVKCVPFRSNLSLLEIQPVLFSVASWHSEGPMCFIKSL